MNEKILYDAYGGLLHDVGKFVQRTLARSDLTEEELMLTPFQKKGNYHSHLHSGYTSRFIRNELKMYNRFEKEVSEHHLQQQRSKEADRIVQADRIASSIDRSDEHSDIEANNKKGSFQTIRLSSVLGEVDFGKKKNHAFFPLSTLSNSTYPKADYRFPDKKEAAEEYKKLLDEMRIELNKTDFSMRQITFDSFNRMYALLYEFATLIPASTYEGNETYVSLFDHLKLTSAIASCLGLDQNEENPTFRMLEFDISGIQNFIFKVTEGEESKKEIAKSLRGRSLYVSLITDFITYSFLNEFGLTQSNIIFNTGGGALLLLPNTQDFASRVSRTAAKLQKVLFDQFHTDITFVYSTVSCDKSELEKFKTDKAIQLKSQLEQEKFKKFQHLIESPNFFVETPQGNAVCELCGSVFTKSSKCSICSTIIEVSNFFVRNHDLIYIVFDFDSRLNQPLIDHKLVPIRMGKTTLYLMNQEIYRTLPVSDMYVETINQASMGSVRYLANMVPFDGKNVMSLEGICQQRISAEWGDQKLGILKMDVDNLGSVFAYGLDKNTRSLSKFLTLSRLIEIFFGIHLETICLEVSDELNPDLQGEETMFYINYAGGDDLVILGPAAGILFLAQRINQRLNEYTQNENITISGGIYIQKPKEPVRFGIHEAEKFLSKSKELSNKNGITLIDTTCSFAEYDQVLKQMMEFRDWIQNKKINRTNFYNLMTLLNQDSFDKVVRNIPIVFYSLKRNVSDEQIRNKFVQSVSKLSQESMDDLRKLVLSMKLAIMLTREIK